MNEKDIKIVREHYIKRVLDNKLPEYQVLDWESVEAQHKRFDTLLNSFDISNASILDVGSGLCNLAEYIDKKNIENVEYTAVDIMSEMIERAKEKKFLNLKPNFIVGNIFNDENILFNRKFDYVYSSGIFNLNTGNNISFLREAIVKFVYIANRGICFNLLDILSSKKYGDKYFYYSKEEVLSIVKNILVDKKHSIDIVDTYLSNDFSVIIRFL